MSAPPTITVKQLPNGRWVAAVKHPRIGRVWEYGPSREMAIDKCLAKLRKWRTR